MVFIHIYQSSSPCRVSLQYSSQSFYNHHHRAGLQLHLARLHGGHPRAFLLQVPSCRRAPGDLHYLDHDDGHGEGDDEKYGQVFCLMILHSNALQGFWEDNRKSLLRFLGESHRGVKGFVKDENFAPIEGASMKVRMNRNLSQISTLVTDIIIII